jgi:hypothetical protein
VEVVGREDERIQGGDELEEAPPRSRGLVGLVFAHPAVHPEPDEGPQVTLEPAGVGGIGGERLERLPELRLRLDGAVRIHDRRLRLDHLAQAPEGRACAIRRRPAFDPGRRRGLAGARDADERHELLVALAARPVERGR